MRARLTTILCTIGLAAAATAVAQPARPAPRRPPPPPPVVKAPPPPPLVGLSALGAFAPERGFLDDVVTTDGARLGVVVTDGADQVELELIGMADAGAIARLDVAAIAPQVRRFYLLGDRVFVVGASLDGGPATGTLLGLDGRPVRGAKKHRPATDVFLRDVSGKPTVIAYTLDPKARGGTLHQLEAFDLMKATKVTRRPGRLLVGPDGRDARLDFSPVYFLDDMTVAVGTRGGVWRKKEDQRSPDTAAAWSLLTGAWVKDEPITDLLGRARQLEVLAASPSRLFARMKEDNSEVEVWRDGVPRAVTLDQPLIHYVAASLQHGVRGDRLWFSLQVDPVNPPAVARKKADPEYLDLFEVDGDRAVRRARILAPKQRLRWGWVGDVLWVMEKNAGFDRGSKLITLYRVD